jgi:agmatine/peptidylarginine deiminase
MATLIGNKGTIIVVDYFVNAWTGHGFGIAKDNKGNLYRVQF